MEDLRGEVLGIVGGLGPLASAELVSTIYRCASWEREQDAPRIVMYSDPSFPDRTTAFLAGEDDAVLRPLVAVLERLVEMGATRLVICCTTAHHLLPRLPQELRARVVSVPRVIVGQLQRAHGRYLMIGTTGTRHFRLLEREPLWERVRERVVFPRDADQEAIHGLIYQLKRMANPAALVPVVRELVEKYGADGFIVGCSEIHILANQLFPGTGPGECIDPYLAIAASLGAARRLPDGALVVTGRGPSWQVSDALLAAEAAV
jgi:aspartate racemase